MALLSFYCNLARERPALEQHFVPSLLFHMWTPWDFVWLTLYFFFKYMHMYHYCQKSIPLAVALLHCMRFLLLLSILGRYDIHHKRYQCQKCQKILSTADANIVAQSGFWPGSITDATYLFHQVNSLGYSSKADPRNIWNALHQVTWIIFQAKRKSMYWNRLFHVTVILELTI